MSDTRRKNADWKLPMGGTDPFTWDHAAIAVLMDIRDELQQANRYLSTLHCSNFQRIPGYLRTIAARRRRVKAKR